MTKTLAVLVLVVFFSMGCSAATYPCRVNWEDGNVRHKSPTMSCYVASAAAMDFNRNFRPVHYVTYHGKKAVYVRGTDMKPILWNRPMLERFKLAYAAAPANPDTPFEFDGYMFLKGYAGELIAYLTDIYR